MTNACSDGTRGNGFKLEEGRCIIKHYPDEAMDATRFTSYLSDGKVPHHGLIEKLRDYLEMKSRWLYADQGSGLLFYDSYKN